MKEALEFKDPSGLNFVYPIPGHPLMRPMQGFLELVSDSLFVAFLAAFLEIFYQFVIECISCTRGTWSSGTLLPLFPKILSQLPPIALRTSGRRG